MYFYCLLPSSEFDLMRKISNDFFYIYVGRLLHEQRLVLMRLNKRAEIANGPR